MHIVSSALEYLLRTRENWVVVFRRYAEIFNVLSENPCDFSSGIAALAD
jgi:hypothetical protein